MSKSRKPMSKAGRSVKKSLAGKSKAPASKRARSVKSKANTNATRRSRNSMS